MTIFKRNNGNRGKKLVLALLLCIVALGAYAMVVSFDTASAFDPPHNSVDPFITCSTCHRADLGFADIPSVCQSCHVSGGLATDKPMPSIDMAETGKTGISHRWDSEGLKYLKKRLMYGMTGSYMVSGPYAGTDEFKQYDITILADDTTTNAGAGGSVPFSWSSYVITDGARGFEASGVDTVDFDNFSTMNDGVKVKFLDDDADDATAAFKQGATARLYVQLLNIPSDPMIALQIYDLYGDGKGRIVCTSCHNQHFHRNDSPYLRINNVSNALCKNCHYDRDFTPYAMVHGEATSGTQTTVTDTAQNWSEDYTGKQVYFQRNFDTPIYNVTVTSNNIDTLTWGSAIGENVTDGDTYILINEIETGGVATSGLSTSLKDTNKTWGVNAHAGKKLYLPNYFTAWGGVYIDIDSNTSDELIFTSYSPGLGSPIGGGEPYAIVDVIDEGFASGGSTTTLKDATRDWSGDNHTGLKLKISTYSGFYRTITTNTTDTLGWSAGTYASITAGDGYKIVNPCNIGMHPTGMTFSEQNTAERFAASAAILPLMLDDKGTPSDEADDTVQCMTCHSPHYAFTDATVGGKATGGTVDSLTDASGSGFDASYIGSQIRFFNEFRPGGVENPLWRKKRIITGFTADTVLWDTNNPLSEAPTANDVYEIVNSAKPGGGYLLDMPNDETICMQCHSYQSHYGDNVAGHITSSPWGRRMTCRDCHTPHNTTNRFLIKEIINDREVKLKPGDNYVNSTGTGICQVCHTKTDHWRNDNTEPIPHYTNGCPQCHNHADSEEAWKPKCDKCHGYPPVPPGTVIPEGARWRVSKNPNSGGAHLPHVIDAGFRCTYCHGHEGFGPTHNQTGCTSYDTCTPIRSNINFNFDSTVTFPGGTKIYNMGATAEIKQISLIGGATVGNITSYNYDAVTGNPTVFREDGTGTETDYDVYKLVPVTCYVGCHNPKPHFPAPENGNMRNHVTWTDTTSSAAELDGGTDDWDNAVDNDGDPTTPDIPCRKCHDWQATMVSQSTYTTDDVTPVAETYVSSHPANPQYRIDCRVCHDLTEHHVIGGTGEVLLSDNDDGGATVYRIYHDAAQLDGHDVEDFCLSCHDGDGNQPFIGGGSTAVPPNIFGVAGGLWADSAHNLRDAAFNGGRPITCLGDGSTTGCHTTPHGSVNERILAGAAITNGTSLRDIEIKEFCFRCHTGGKVVNNSMSKLPNGTFMATSIEEAFALSNGGSGGYGKHPLGTTFDIPFASTTGYGGTGVPGQGPAYTGTTYKLQCTSCHNPHIITGRYWEHDQTPCSPASSNNNGCTPITIPDTSADPAKNPRAMGTILWGDDASEKMDVYAATPYKSSPPEPYADAAAYEAATGRTWHTGLYMPPNTAVGGFAANVLPAYPKFCLTCHGDRLWDRNPHGQATAGTTGLIPGFSPSPYSQDCPNWRNCGRGYYWGYSTCNMGLGDASKDTCWPVISRSHGYPAFIKGTYNMKDDLGLRNAGVNFVLSCTDCHEVHGSTKFYQLRPIINTDLTGDNDIEVSNNYQWWGSVGGGEQGLCYNCHTINVTEKEANWHNSCPP